MNSLSWFLYLADALSSLGGFAVTIAIMTCLSILPLLITCAVGVQDNERSNPTKAEAFRNGRRYWLPRLVALTVVFGFIACLIPSKNTMYAIAASEVGERMAKSKVVQGVANDATEALQQWIKRQIESERQWRRSK